jgi:hypothetical protein
LEVVRDKELSKMELRRCSLRRTAGIGAVMERGL